ncbi:MAG: protease modulator HflK [Candidatus Hydrogenedentota bacterium]
MEITKYIELLKTELKIHIAAYIKLIAGIIIVSYLLSGITVIKTSELGIAERFGTIIDKGIQPGIHYFLPYPFTYIYKIHYQKYFQIDIDDFYHSFEANSVQSELWINIGIKSYAITGDNNIVYLKFILKYRIIDPLAYLFSSNGLEPLLKHLTCNSLVATLSTLKVDDVLTTFKKEMEYCLKKTVQQKINFLNLGVEITLIEIKEVSPPPETQDSFNDVIQARMEKERMVNDALLYQNEQLPLARAESRKILEQARGYQYKRIKHSQSLAERFNSLINSPDIYTQHKLYLEFIAEVFPKLKEVIIVDNGEKKIIDLRLLDKK